VRLWDVATGKARWALPQDTTHTHAVVYSPDRRRLATGDREGIRLWDAGTGRQLFEMHYDKAPRDRDYHFSRRSFDAFFTPDGRVLVGASTDWTLSYWDTATGRQSRTPSWGGLVLHYVAVSADGRWLAVETSAVGNVPAGTRDQNEIHLLERASGREVRRLRYEPKRVAAMTSMDMNTMSVDAAAFSPDSRLFALRTSPRQVQLWHVATGGELRTLSGHDSPITSISFSPDGKILASCEGMVRQNGIASEKRVHFWDVASGREVFRYDERRAEDACNSVAFSRDGRLWASAGAQVQVHETATGEVVLRFAHGWAYSACFSPDGSRLASAMQSGGALVWDMTPPGWKLAGPQPPRPGELDGLWRSLAGADAPAAYRAVWTLAAAPDQAVHFLKSRLRPVPGPTPARVRQLIADLDADDFAVRQAASAELGRLGDQAEVPLRKALAQATSPEARARLEGLLNDVGGWIITEPESLRTVRAIWVLQRIGSNDARAILEDLSRGAAGARITQEAKAALAYLAKRDPAEAKIRATGGARP
jgi:WD40 repeat protein